eukprot:5973483-Heterocapsa_arctica.AAC.1
MHGPRNVESASPGDDADELDGLCEDLDAYTKWQSVSRQPSKYFLVEPKVSRVPSSLVGECR